MATGSAPAPLETLASTRTLVRGPGPLHLSGNQGRPKRRIPVPASWGQWLRLVLVLVGMNATAPALLAQTPSQESRVLADEEKDALRTWAHRRLEELESRSRDGSWTLPYSPETERLWALYFLSVEEREWEERAVTLADSLGVLEGPEFRQIQALGGALEVVRAKNSRWPPNKLKHLRRGLAILDGLVEDAPQDPVVRYLRLVSCYYLPFFLDREESVEEDFRVLAEVLPEEGIAFSPPVRATVLDFVLEKGEIEDPDRTRLDEALQELRSLAGPLPEGRGQAGTESPRAFVFPGGLPDASGGDLDPRVLEEAGEAGEEQMNRIHRFRRDHGEDGIARRLDARGATAPAP